MPYDVIAGVNPGKYLDVLRIENLGGDFRRVRLVDATPDGRRLIAGPVSDGPNVPNEIGLYETHPGICREP
jgi:hypothetical protein